MHPYVGRFTPCQGQNIPVGHPSDFEERQTALSRAKVVAGPSQAQVLLGELESVGDPFDDLQPIYGLSFSGVGQQQAVALVRSTAHASPELV